MTYAGKKMRRNPVQSKNAKLQQFLIGIRTAGLSPIAAVALGMAACLLPETVHAQEYPWCLSREGYLYCFYKTQEQCQWTASGHRRLRLESAFAFPEQAARFRRERYRSKAPLSSANEI
jgi:hypothetical protein